MVSFGLTLATAMVAQRVQVREGHPLLRELAQHLWRRPQDFLFPPRDEPAREATEEAPASHRMRRRRTSGTVTRR